MIQKRKQFWKLMHQTEFLKKYCFNMSKMKHFNQSCTFLLNIILRNAITRFIIRNYWLLSRYWKNDAQNYKMWRRNLKSSQITKIFNILWSQNCLIRNRSDEMSFSQDSTSELFIIQISLQTNQTLFLKKQKIDFFSR